MASMSRSRAKPVDTETKDSDEVDTESKESDEVRPNLDDSSVLTNGAHARGKRAHTIRKGWIICATVVLIVAIVISVQLSNYKSRYLQTFNIKPDQDSNNTADSETETSSNEKLHDWHNTDVKPDQENNKPVDSGSDKLSDKEVVDNLQDNDVKTDQNRNKPTKYESEPMSNRNLEHLQDIDVRTHQDSKLPVVYSLGVVSGSRMIVVDWKNLKVKLLDTTLGKVTSELMLNRYTWDVDVIDEHSAAVTLPDISVIQFVTIESDTLSLGQKISTRGKCYGISYWDNKLAATCQVTVGQWSLYILDLTGNVLNSIKPERNGQLLFSNPFQVTVSDDQELYVSDAGRKAVYRLGEQGGVKAIYEHPDVQWPHGLAVSPSGLVYFSDWQSGSVFHFDPASDITSVQKVLGRENKLEIPISAACSGNKLYIGTGKGKVQVYHWKA